jgi:hypothetical protein
MLCGLFQRAQQEILEYAGARAHAARFLAFLDAVSQRAALERRRLFAQALASVLGGFDIGQRGAAE